jgi:uncharacterized protein YjgD (DUF1641 family)
MKTLRLKIKEYILKNLHIKPINEKTEEALKNELIAQLALNDIYIDDDEAKRIANCLIYAFHYIR